MTTTFPENAMLALSALFFGIMAGFFWTYSFNINLAMLEVSGPVYAQVQSLFNQNVRHATFFTFFFGSGVVSFIALIVNWRHRTSLAFALLGLAFLVYGLGIILFTRNVNLPLNYYTESWELSALPSDWASIREQWNRANNIRVAMAGTAFILSLSALVVRCSFPDRTQRAT
ncbi:DUF1772 domain-containing protein [Saccharospirillum alexandrii]|uniref:DUF1772 domain-containing protein n=1 Tax=Saccharospirillum alexandrii TaxID=2448477 RepID=UPI000FD81166|nr:DUF1772 domain-containing protein [Saccharospirillum alexandrii]